MIIITYSTIDRFRKRSKFKTLAGARKFAQHWLGKYPEMGSSYAVSGDGVGKITVQGCELSDLFGEEGEEAPGFDEPKPPEWTGFDSQEIDY